MIGKVFGRLQQGLRKTRERFALRVKEILSGRTTVDDDLYDKLEQVLIEADLGVKSTERILAAVSERVRTERITDPAQVQVVLGDVLRGLLDGVAPAPAPELDGPDGMRVVLVVGVNGVGKTTTIGKLASHYSTAGRKVLVCAGDTFRAAAIEQLEVWSARAGVRVVKHREGADPAAVVFDALEAAEAGGKDLVLIDTAGRLHNKDNLMAELEKIRRVIAKRIDGAPHETLLILDATTGQNGLLQAREFSARVGVTGLVITKLDGTAKGGVIVPIVTELGVPIRFIGIGEGIDDLVPFDGSSFASAIVGV